jgi:uncharacterized MAPEG superfamily protein
MNLSQVPTQTVLIGAIAGAAAAVYFPFLAVAYARVTHDYDMGAPRAMFDKLPAYGQRATWAHQNGWESFVLFTAAALMAYVTGQDGDTLKLAALGYVLARFLYGLFYILNVPILRSLMFALGTSAIFTLMAASITSSLALIT